MTYFIRPLVVVIILSAIAVSLLACYLAVSAGASVLGDPPERTLSQVALRLLQSDGDGDGDGDGDAGDLANEVVVGANMQEEQSTGPAMTIRAAIPSLNPRPEPPVADSSE